MLKFIKRTLVGFLGLGNIESYSFINGITNWNRPIYISRSLSDFHTDCVKEAIHTINKYDTSYSHVDITKKYLGNACIRVSYYEMHNPQKRLTGSTKFTGTLFDDNQWYIDSMHISMNEDIQPFDTCVNLLVHEILHTKGLHHSDDPNSIMNMSVYITTDGEVLNAERAAMGIDDIMGLIAVEQS